MAEKKINMSRRTKDITWVSVLSILCGLIIWHTIQWHSTGMYLQMFTWLGTDRGYITVLYNLGLMLVLSTVLAYLMEKFVSFISYEKDARNK